MTLVERAARVLRTFALDDPQGEGLSARTFIANRDDLLARAVIAELFDWLEEGQDPNDQPFFDRYPWLAHKRKEALGE